jgi:hypothetical protein
MCFGDGGCAVCVCVCVWKSDSEKGRESYGRDMESSRENCVVGNGL